jgi:hypothetical protein
MGFIIVPLQQPRATEVSQRPLGLPVVQVKWTQQGDKLVTLRQLALDLCTEPKEILKDILELRANAHVVDQLYQDFGAPAQKQLAEKIKNDPELRAAYDFLSRDADDRRPGDTQRPADAFPNVPFKVQGLRLAAGTVEDFRDWSVNVEGRGVFLTLEYSQHAYDMCSTNRSTINWLKKEVDDFQAAVIKVDPFLNQLEAALQRYEAKAKAWSQGVGKPALEAGAILSTFEATADVYSAQDRRAQMLTAHARELGEQLGDRINAHLRNFCAAELQGLRAVDSSKQFHDALLQFLLVWSPTRHYYFHAVAAAAVGKPDFEQRLFNGIQTCAQYLASSPSVASEMGSELARNMATIWRFAVEGASPANEPIGRRTERARALIKELEKGGGIASTLSIVATWCALFASLFGNIEGPPTVLSAVLKAWSQSDQFVARMEKDTLLKSVLLIGVSKLERMAIFNQIKAGKVELASEFFNNSSWRSPRIYAGYFLMNLAVLIVHIDELSAKLARDGDQMAFDRDFIATYGPLVLDAANFGLLGTTVLYSRDLNEILEYSLSRNARALPTLFENIETKGWRVVAAKMLHRTLAGVGFVVSAADIYYNFNSSDDYEKAIKVGMLGSSILVGLSLFKTLSFLGPWGVGAAVVATAAQLIYSSYFKPKMATTLQGMLAALDANAFYLSQRASVVETTAWIQVLGVTLISNRTTLQDVFDKLSSLTGSMSYASKLDKSRMLDYHLGGIPVEALIALYEIERDDVMQALRSARFKRVQQHQPVQAVDAQLVSPATESTALIVGAVNRISVLVFNHPCNAIWLEWTRGNPADFVGGPSFDAARSVVLLQIDSSTRRRNGVQAFVGEFSIERLPEPVGGKVEAAFRLRVPKGRNPRFPKPDSSFDRPLSFPIIDPPAP